MVMHRTKTDEALAEAERAHNSDPERAELLARARRFKASWIDLAESCEALKRNGRWKEWGYDSFEAYAKGELRIRQETADKLTGSYTFLKRRAPGSSRATRSTSQSRATRQWTSFDARRPAREPQEHGRRDSPPGARGRGTAATVARAYRRRGFPHRHIAPQDQGLDGSGGLRLAGAGQAKAEVGEGI